MQVEVGVKSNWIRQLLFHSEAQNMKLQWRQKHLILKN